MEVARGDDGGAGSGGGGGKTTDPTADGRQPPAKAGGNKGSGSGTVIAIRKLYLGDTNLKGAPDANGWKKIGYNLDGIKSTKNGTNHCKLHSTASPSSVKPDGEDGIDNSFGANILKVIQSAGVASPTGEVTTAIESGDFTVMLALKNIDAEKNQTDIETWLYGGSKLDPAPNWDGNDEWPLTYELLNGGDANSPKVTFQGGYVADGTWVSGSKGTIDLSVTVSGEAINLKNRTSRGGGRHRRRGLVAHRHQRRDRRRTEDEPTRRRTRKGCRRAEQGLLRQLGS